MPLPDAYKKIQAYDQIRRRPGEVIRDYFRRVRNSRAEKTGGRCRGHQVTSRNSSVYSDAEDEMVENEDTFTEAPRQQEETGQTFFELEIRGYCLLQNARLHTGRATDGACWNKKRHGVHSYRNTAAWRLG